MIEAELPLELLHDPRCLLCLGVSTDAQPLVSAGSAAAPSTHAHNDDSDATLTQAAKRARVHEDTTLERSDELLSCPDADVPSDPTCTSSLDAT